MKSEITGLKVVDIPDVLEICGEALGEGYISARELEEYISHFQAIGLKRKGMIAGISLVRMLAIRELDNYFNGEIRNVIEWLGFPQTIGFRKLTAVRRQFRGKGIGRMLTAESMSVLRNPEAIISITWENSMAMRHLLSEYGMKEIITLDAFWEEDSLLKGYSCPVCGNPCRCKAVVYGKRN